jgi:hypothetical protein
MEFPLLPRKEGLVGLRQEEVRVPANNGPLRSRWRRRQQVGALFPKVSFMNQPGADFSNIFSANSLPKVSGLQDEKNQKSRFG